VNLRPRARRRPDVVIARILYHPREAFTKTTTGIPRSVTLAAQNSDKSSQNTNLPIPWLVPEIVAIHRVPSCVDRIAFSRSPSICSLARPSSAPWIEPIVSRMTGIVVRARTPSCAWEGDPARYDPVTIGEHLATKPIRT
jgi:hypothetical protein